VARRRLTRGLAALFPPLAVLSSAHELYLRNQPDLDGTLSVLHPFWGAAALASLVVLLLQRAEGVAPARAALVAFYTAGFAFVVWTFLRALPAGAHFTRWVLEAGYRTVGFVPPYLYGTHRAAFDLSVLHGENLSEPDLPGLHAAVFLRAWAYGVLPRAVGERLAAGRFLGFDTGFLQMASVERLSTYAQPLVSRLSMEVLLELEPRLPPRGRYTLVHLLLPHNPCILRADCSRALASQPTDLAQQTECALLLLQRYLEALRRLGRLDGSVVLVHGDHGSGEVIRDGRLVPEDAAWLRTVILVKPEGARGPMRDAAEAARLVDIAPTLLALLGIEREAPFDGRVLREALVQPIGRAARAGTPAPRVRGGRSAVKLPAATND
jgi:hypothetical protein